jgi:hypothetical protein
VPTIASVEHSHIGPRQVKRFATFDANDFNELSRIGIQLPPLQLRRMIEAVTTFDALDPTLTTGSINTPVQFLQNWLPGFVNIVTAPRKIDELVGITTSGSWEDEEIVQGVMEVTGTSVPYSDYGNVPLASWNVNFNTRTVVRFEEGMRVGTLEEARASRMRVNTASAKREGATLALEIQRNAVGFFGYNSGDNLTYGFLNDPGLPAYIEFPNGASTFPQWSTKTFIEITKDIRTMLSGLRVATQDLVDPETTAITLGLATAVVDYLTVTTDFGVSVRDWLTKTYPRVRIVSAPELDGAHAGLNVAILYAENVSDMSTDDGRTWLQCVPAKFRVCGVQTLTKGYEEVYSNATSGVMCKRPYAVIRYYGC